MRYTILFSILLFVFFTGCKKNNAGSAPTLKFKNVNSTEFQSGDILVFTLSFDGGSANGTDTIYVEEDVPNCPASSFNESYGLPSYPVTKGQKGEITVTFGYNSNSSYQNISPQCQENDTAVFRFALKDNAQHTSDTVSSPKVILYY